MPADQQKWLWLPEGDQQSFEPANYADGLAQVRLRVARIRERFSDSGKKVLLVGHSLAGSRLMEELLGREPQGRLNVANARLSCLH